MVSLTWIYYFHIMLSCISKISIKFEIALYIIHPWIELLMNRDIRFSITASKFQRALAIVSLTWIYYFYIMLSCISKIPLKYCTLHHTSNRSFSSDKLPNLFDHWCFNMLLLKNNNKTEKLLFQSKNKFPKNKIKPIST